jgi:hypothetical protein
VERVVLNALTECAASRPDIAPTAIANIVFGAVTDAKQRPGFPADPPTTLVHLCESTHSLEQVCSDKYRLRDLNFAADTAPSTIVDLGK